MREATREKKGSHSRDAFKFKHKPPRLPGWCYACDVDFALVSKAPPGVVAFVDYKVRGEKVLFSEVLAYNELLSIAPVFIIEGDYEADGPFDVLEYEGGDWRPEPPRVNTRSVLRMADWAMLSQWEQTLRNVYQAERVHA